MSVSFKLRLIVVSEDKLIYELIKECIRLFFLRKSFIDPLNKANHDV